MLSLRESFSTSHPYSTSFCIVLFHTVLLYGFAFSANHEASILYSWIHSPASPLPPSFTDWNILDTNPCNWTSITCCPQGFVTEINIHSIPLVLPLPSNLSSFHFLRKLVIFNANLTGTIPVNIGDCSALTVIDLSSNNLVGFISASIGKLKNLESLILNSNQLTGRIPVEISNCTGLKKIVVFDNQLGGSIPTVLGNLSKLEDLRAGRNTDIVGNIPKELGECSNLTVLRLADTQISGSLPTSLGKLSKLQTLSIYITMLSGEIPPELGNCSELEDLFLGGNGLSGSIPSELGKLQNLHYLFLWQNNLVGAIPAEIGNCTSLRQIKLSSNSLTGNIPKSLGGLLDVEYIGINQNNLSGSIPSCLSNATNLQVLVLYSNQLSGLIPPELGQLSKFIVFYAWQNQIEGSIPSTLANCSNLQELDLSLNLLTGGIPIGLFQLRNLKMLLLIFNNISDSIPSEIGNSSSLIRLRLANNMITGEIPKTIGRLKKLNFLDLSSNHLAGQVPDEIGSCIELQMIDFSRNNLEGPLPNTLSSLFALQVLDASSNKFSGHIPSSLGLLILLSKLILSRNSFSGPIPPSLGMCSSLQLLDLSSNKLTGSIPSDLGHIENLEIALNLSCNSLTGTIPDEISALNKLSILDLSHNQLEGDLHPLAGLESLVTLNVSYNKFTGYLVDNKLFRNLSPNDLTGNQGLCSLGQDSCFKGDSSKTGVTLNENGGRKSQRLKLIVTLLIVSTMLMIVIGVIAVIKAQKNTIGDASQIGESLPWQFIPFQKLKFSEEQVLRCLVDENVIGKGISSVVYHAEMDNGEVIAVKKLWPIKTASGEGLNGCKKSKKHDSFSTEVKTLGSVRHKNIVRFLGCCWNHDTRLLIYDYMPNGSLSSLLHERTENPLDWETRYKILLGAAQGLEYLHHECGTPILHRDIKANNILIDSEFEPYIADFGLAKLLDDDNFSWSSNDIAGSFGYIDPECFHTMKMTEKSDVYSFGVVLLEVLTGKQPLDPKIPYGLHVVDWVKRIRGVKVFDPSLLSRSETNIEEMMQALNIALSCVNSPLDERPTMRDVTAMIKQIKHKRKEYARIDVLLRGPYNYNFVDN